MFKTILLRIAIPLVVLILCAGRARADSVVYTFTGVTVAVNNPLAMFPPQTVGFQLTAPGFINPPFPTGFPPDPASFVMITCAQLDSATNCRPTGTTLIFSNQGTGPFTAILDFTAGNFVGYSFHFPTGAFGAFGTYNSGVTPNVGTLTVSSVPENSVIVLLLTGVLSCGLFRWRRTDGIGA